MDKTPAVSLQVPARATFVPLVNTFVKNASLAFGLGEPEALALTLATEEIFVYLSQSAAPGCTVDISCASGCYYVRTVFECATQEFNLNAFNLTSTVSLDTESGLAEMGLVLASRSVDRFQVSRAPERGLRLTLIKEKSYPEAGAKHFAELREMLRPYTTRAPNAEEIKLLVQFANQVYPAHLLPAFLHYPGKVVDMIGAGEYQAAIVVGAKGQIGGAILWHWAGQKTVECFGPYVFDTIPEIANTLLESCLGAIAKTRAVCLINRLPTPDLPQEHFEALGTLTLFNRDGAPESTTYLRHLQEDEGSMMWAHPDLEEFLRHEYRRHILPRDIVVVKNEMEARPPFSVLSTEIDRMQNQVTLRPIWTGSDAGDNLRRHINLLQQEKLANVFFEMDLGESWQTDFTPALLECGFVPRLVLPYAGKGDLVIFQLGARPA